jgi:hypothetical protein
MSKSPRRSRKKSPPTMTVAQFAVLKGVSRQAVRAAIERGEIPPAATCWTTRGKQKVLMIVDVPLASKLWTPAELPEPPAAGGLAGPLSEATSTPEAKRLFAVYRAQQAKLDFEAASGKLVPLEHVRLDVNTCIIQARSAFLNIGWKAMAKLSLTRDQACDINDLARDILEELAESTKRALAKVADPSKGESS